MNNINEKVLENFGEEWTSFDQSLLSEKEAKDLFDRYFNIFPSEFLQKNKVGIYICCGSGRWAKFVAPKVKKLYLIDPSKEAISVAEKKLSQFNNLEFSIASADSFSVDDESLDFAY